MEKHNWSTKRLAAGSSPAGGALHSPPSGRAFLLVRGGTMIAAAGLSPGFCGWLCRLRVDISHEQSALRGWVREVIPGLDALLKVLDLKHMPDWLRLLVAGWPALGLLCGEASEVRGGATAWMLHGEEEITVRSHSRLLVFACRPGHTTGPAPCRAKASPSRSRQCRAGTDLPRTWLEMSRIRWVRGRPAASWWRWRCPPSPTGPPSSWWRRPPWSSCEGGSAAAFPA
jgi:hypothetical protein